MAVALWLLTTKHSTHLPAVGIGTIATPTKLELFACDGLQEGSVRPQLKLPSNSHAHVMAMPSDVDLLCDTVRKLGRPASP